MAQKDKLDLREVLIDAHAHFFFLKGDNATRVRLIQIRSDCVIIEMPKAQPMRSTVLGYIPTLDGRGVFEVEGAVSTEMLPDQAPGTVRIVIDSSNVRRVNRRLYPRVNFTPPIEGMAESDTGKTPFKILDFSAGGLRIETQKELSPTETYKFRFKIETEDEEHKLVLPGMIVYEIPSDTCRSYGVRFSHPKMTKEGEAPVEALDQTVDLLNLVNKLLVREI